MQIFYLCRLRPKPRNTHAFNFGNVATVSHKRYSRDDSVLSPTHN